eukprot:SAG31_NODE_5398_length_2560_cov_2.708537_2_plen_69_part_00
MDPWPIRGIASMGYDTMSVRISVRSGEFKLRTRTAVPANLVRRVVSPSLTPAGLFNTCSDSIYKYDLK